MHIINITKKMKKQIPKKEEEGTKMTKGLLFSVIKEGKNKSTIIILYFEVSYLPHFLKPQRM